MRHPDQGDQAPHDLHGSQGRPRQRSRGPSAREVRLGCLTCGVLGLASRGWSCEKRIHAFSSPTETQPMPAPGDNLSQGGTHALVVPGACLCSGGRVLRLEDRLRKYNMKQAVCLMRGLERTSMLQHFFVGCGCRGCADMRGRSLALSCKLDRIGKYNSASPERRPHLSSLSQENHRNWRASTRNTIRHQNRARFGRWHLRRSAGRECSLRDPLRESVADLCRAREKDTLTSFMAQC